MNENIIIIRLNFIFTNNIKLIINNINIILKLITLDNLNFLKLKLEYTLHCTPLNELIIELTDITPKAT